jgi:hypothetical protein
MSRMQLQSMLGMWVTLAAAAAGGGGCAASQGQNTRLTDDDLLVASNRMVESLAASDFLEGRTPASPPVVVVTNKVENLTDQIIPQGKQWATVLRVQNALPVQEFSKQHNIRFVVPPEREDMAQGSGVPVADGGGLQPTHVLTATFTSAARVGGKKDLIQARQDYYYLEFRLSEIQSRELVWADAFEFKRQATGTLIN